VVSYCVNPQTLFMVESESKDKKLRQSYSSSYVTRREEAHYNPNAISDLDYAWA